MLEKPYVDSYKEAKEKYNVDPTVKPCQGASRKE
jgi:hypothetical protein